ncbi:MAG TPA: XdhC/CoxI family protein [Candidatus Nitrosotalea sp.]|nr:XdhC/CoxI family protein [Candidatus Nitrosotalea sp.]
MREVQAELAAWLAEGEQVAIATVVETWGSSPRPVGSHMIVSASGKMAGSVSNGCIEGDVFVASQEVISQGRGRLLEFGVADDVAFGAGLACGGHIELFVSPIEAAHVRALEVLTAGQRALLRTNLDSGEVVLAEQDPGFELPRSLDRWFEEPLLPPAQMVIVGAIHIAIPLHHLAKLMGYGVSVVDARAQFATAERFPAADRIVVRWPDEALAEMSIARSDAVVILTHDPKFDLPALRSALATQVGYIGAIGSRKTSANRLRALKAEGFSSGDLARIHGPIGLDLGGRDAESTALGIMAEVIAVRYGGRAKSLSSAPGPRSEDAVG